MARKPVKRAKNTSGKPPFLSSDYARRVPPLYRAEDVSEIAQSCGVVIASGVEAQWVSRELMSAVFRFGMRYGAAIGRPATGDLREWLESVESGATSLLDLLGLSADEYAGFDDTSRHLFLPARDYLKDGIFAQGQGAPPCFPMELLRLLGNDRFILAEQRALRAAKVRGETLSGETLSEAKFVEAAYCLLDLTPYVLGLLVRLARSAPQRRERAASGRHSEEARAALFLDLILTFQQMTGVRPRTRNKAGYREPESPVLQWVRSVLALAAKRLAEANDTSVANWAIALRKVLELSDATLSDLLEAETAEASRRVGGTVRAIGEPERDQ